MPLTAVENMPFKSSRIYLFFIAVENRPFNTSWKDAFQCSRKLSSAVENIVLTAVENMSFKSSRKYSFQQQLITCFLKAAEKML